MTTQNIDVLVNFKSNTSSLTGGIGQVNNSMGTLTNSLNKLPALIATAFAVDKVIDFGKVATKTFASFEQAMASVKAKTNASGKEFTALTDKAKELGRTTTKTATDVANAMTILAGGGMDVDAIQTNIETIIKIAEAGGVDVASSAEKIMTAKATYGITNLEEFMDKLAKIDNEAQGSFMDYLDTFQVAGSNLKGFNVEMNEAVALIGALATKGDMGTQLGTSINSIFVNLLGGTKTVQDALDKLNVSLFDKETGEKRNAMDMLKELAYKLGEENTTLTEQEKENLIADIAGKNQIAPFKHVLEVINEGLYDKLKGYAEDSSGALDKLVEIQKDTLKGRMAGLSSAWEGFLIEIGDLLNIVVGPAVESLTELLTKLTNPIAEWNKKRAEAKANATQSTEDNVVKVTEEEYGSAFKEWLKQEVGSVYYKKKLEKVDSSSYLSNGENWFNNNIKAPLGDGFNKIKESIPKLMESFTKFIDKLKPGLEKLGKMFTSIGKTLGDLWAKYGQYAMEKLSSAIDLISSALPHIGEIFSDIFAILSNAWENVGRPIFDALYVVIELLRHQWEETFPTLKAIWDALWSYISDFWTNTATPMLNGIIYFIGGVLTGDWQKCWDGLRLIFDGVWNAIIKIAEIAVNLIIGLINNLINKWNELFAINLPSWMGGGTLFEIGNISEVSFDRLNNDYTDEYKKENWNQDYYGKSEFASGNVKWNAQGGVFQTPTLLGGRYGVGEVGAEAIVPLSRLERMVNNPIKVQLAITNFNNYSTDDLDQIVDYIDSAIAQKSELNRRNNGGLGR